MAPRKKGVAVDATPVGKSTFLSKTSSHSPPDVNAPRKTRNQKKAAEPNPTAPRPKPRRRAPGKQPAAADEQFIIQRASGSQPPADSPAAPVPGSLNDPPPPPVVSAQAAPTAPPVAPPETVGPAADQCATPAPDPSNLFDEITPPPGNQRAQRPDLNTSTTPSRRSTRPAVEVIPDEDDPPSRQATPTPDDSDSSSDDEDIHLPLPPGIDSFSELGWNSKTKPVVKPGPIPAAAQEAAFLLHAQYQRNIEELAAKHGKSPEAFYALLGSGSHLTRGRDFNSWAAWQAWYSVHGPSKPDHVSVADWTRHVSKEYVQHIFEGLNGRPDTPANRREVLDPTVQWYRERFANQVAHYRSEGKMKQVLDKVINECLRVSTMAYELYNVHVCGFAVNLDPDNSNRTHSAPFGASPEYEEMLKKNKPVITRELNLWESHLRIARASASTAEIINTTLFFVGTGKVIGEPSKDRHRRLFSAFLRADLGMSQHISMSNS
ncbi:hypothetical protein H0H92_004299 [Tricholoma furcatifolium]|nr:hypothetical protein H0H92_004299 [Tricholoma furcatifolium]